ncbi:polyribonucleotide nucleotidyltransferase [Candidatus Peregrinibacteria bacterium CG_4_9_14_0_2_um_filter_53_11]|nr:MAG: polyribonucleotide nucleotidyltransferase [Candidatus Peregrinibacteria bacterium CG_4_9_14_0_2_um_filter_53_11]
MGPTNSVELNLAGRDFSLSTGLLALQADGAVLASLGDTQILATALMSSSPRQDVDFFPLMVDFEEKYYAAGKIKGSRFIKREGRPSDNAVLTARLIDRPIRPLFPKGVTNDVQIMVTVLSVDLEVDPGTTGINAASAALMISGMPFHGPVGAVRIGYITDSEGKEQLVVNPTYEQVDGGRLNLVVAGTMDAITMVEAACNEVPEEVLLEALDLAHRQIKKLCQLQIELRDKVAPKPRQMIFRAENEAAVEAVKRFFTPEMGDSVQGTTKHDVKEKVHLIEDKMLEAYATEIENGAFRAGELKGVLNDLLEKHMRHNILEKEVRIDGRGVKQIRPLSSMVGLIKRTHGSALFQRGETQALSLTTLGSPGAAQTIDTMDEDSIKRYIHHYNFPPFSVGEVKPLRGTSRREIGHGDLAERALIPVLPSKEDFPYTMRVVSEILTCNGSSSMASVCGSTLSLMDAGVPLIRPVAGIAMGLITKADFDGTPGSYKILSDIQGMEDFAGDMDFKVTGTEQGITALQMDIKVKGLSLDIMREALEQAKAGRAEILASMLATLPATRDHLSPYAPLITTLRIQPDQIREVIGRGGEMIQKITAETGCEIDIEQDGLVTVTAPNQENGKQAIDWIGRITYIPEAGDEFEGTVTRLMDFGAFVEFSPGKEGLVHISEWDWGRTERMEDVTHVDDTIKVKLMEVDDQGRYNLSRKALLQKPEGYEERPRSEGFGGRPGGGGGGRPRPGGHGGGQRRRF